LQTGKKDTRKDVRLLFDDGRKLSQLKNGRRENNFEKSSRG